MHKKKIIITNNKICKKKTHLFLLKGKFSKIIHLIISNNNKTDQIQDQSLKEILKIIRNQQTVTTEHHMGEEIINLHNKC